MAGVRRKRMSPGAGQDDGLCCCEYMNQDGERSHMAACLCDCEDLDRACDSWISCRSLQPEVLARALQTASDRCRVPWIRGARRFDPTLLPPLFLLPASLHLAALHPLLTAATLGSLPPLVIWYYRLTHRRRGRTLLFLSLALFSLGYMHYTFTRQVLLRGRVGWGQYLGVTGGLLLTLLCLARAKCDPGYLQRSGARGAERGGAQQSAGKDWCRVCQLARGPRAGHCGICGSCVRRMDHHCVWINNCIGARNHRPFLLLLLAFQFTSVYGIILTLSAICRGHSVLSALFYCPGVYANYSTSFAFACVWYCAVVAAGMGYVLLVQLLNVSYNVTEREARVAMREKTGRWVLGGLALDTGTYNRGFLQNWRHFLCVEEAGPDPPDIV